MVPLATFLELYMNDYEVFFAFDTESIPDAWTMLFTVIFC
jgi:hypothetical protein